MINDIILGIIQGITEFFPISSTAHLMIIEHLLATNSDSSRLTNTVIQLASVLAIIIYYRVIILAQLKSILSFKFPKLTLQLILAFLPTAITGFLLYKHISQYLSSTNIMVFNLIFGGIILLFVENKYSKETSKINKLDDISNRNAFIIGLFQSIALIPGISRLGSTVIGGLVQGFSRKNIIEFSFLLSIPTILSASLYTIYKYIQEFNGINNYDELIISFITTFVVSLGTIKIAINFIERISFIPFAYYRIILGIIIFFI